MTALLALTFARLRTRLLSTRKLALPALSLLLSAGLISCLRARLLPAGQLPLALLAAGLSPLLSLLAATAIGLLALFPLLTSLSALLPLLPLLATAGCLLSLLSLLSLLALLPGLALLPALAVLCKLRVASALPILLLLTLHAIPIHFVFELLGQVIELIPRLRQPLRVIPQNALRRLLHTLAKLREIPPRIIPGPLSLLRQAFLYHVPAGVELAARITLRRLPNRVIEFLGEQRLGGLGIFHRLAHVVHHLIELLALLPEPLRDLLALLIL